MKHLLFTALLIIGFGISNNSSAQNQIQLADIELTNLGDGQMYGHSRDEEKTPINGKSRIITGFTTEYIDAEFAKGYAIGKWEYYKDNKLSVYVTYDNGYMDGEYAELFPSGTPKLEGKFVKGKKEGEWQTYNSDGDKKLTEVYKANELEKKITYYTNGNIDTERNYKNGKEDGAVKQYTLEGVLKSEKNFVNGKQVGKQIQYYASNNGDYIETSNYSPDGKKEGEYSEVYADSKSFKVKGQYSKNQKDGKWVFENKAGKRVREEVYENGVLKTSTKIE
ncbi:antitoxin component YwqK of YwqJK toxin-antitoxin module [Dysgonomonas alginatilytica]|uniref:Antitoxin component YwqK of YwqJK toxin-antitoxin module n=1 Tax=Dysgonomonas alginatilytica TaxID=1605892 RepID=A0A2V3PV91_9BACT|nr:hypothetical protein [Dysgonomonas alginatilytica]PXV68816.1 antitoxin component YwqK of YwqJK toxin-antitoxin module [Dysgonomonas alginatilytica]